MEKQTLGILIGGRLDKHNMVDDVIFSPRANLRFNPMDNINLRLSYSSGFRAPQAFDEDMHIENVGGTVVMIERAKDLKEENRRVLVHPQICITALVLFRLIC